ncbi:alpha-amylase family glycosyl hydrolase [Rhizobium sp. LjRoot30]|uniref:alpha-amylase family glycosyl hydrolase n=1 Tax=Rhizobium sp. LjRoot30 TaxID=3342320 RepID=UPI003ECEA60E
MVYNHFGPEGNYLPRFAPGFFHTEQDTPWGPAINYGNDAVRRYFIDNVLYWLGEFRLDGLRFDAIDYIKDDSDVHLLHEISETVYTAFPDRHVHLMTENPPNGTDLLAKGLFVADWNDAFHHIVHRITTGETIGHFKEFKRNPWEELRLVLAEGYLSPGQPTVDKDLPAPASLPPTAFIHFLQNHDQVGNRALGDRLASRIDDRLYRALVCILLMSPQIPLLFMGDDYKEINSFHYFSDYEGELAEIIRANRSQEAENFGGYPAGSSKEDIPDPNTPSTFQMSKLRWDHAEASEGTSWSNWIREILAVRQTKIVPLLAEAGGYAGTIVPSPAETVFVDWQLGQTTLQLRANLSAIPCSFEPCGDLVFTSDSDPRSLDLGSFEVKVFALKT